MINKYSHKSLFSQLAETRNYAPHKVVFGASHDGCCQLLYGQPSQEQRGGGPLHEQRHGGELQAHQECRIHR